MRRNLITLTPLIDVVFILLVFFMLASSFLDWRTIELGVAKSAGRGSMEGAMLVELRDDGIRLSGRTVDETALVQALRSRFSEKPAQKVLVKPGPGIRLQAAVDLIDRIVAAGGRDVMLVSAKGS